MKPFENWLTQEVKQTFGIQEVEKNIHLEAWLAANIDTTETELQQLEKLRLRLHKKVKYWNEDELKFFFISQLIDLVDFNSNKQYAAFTQRILSAKILTVQKEIMPLRGRVEWFVATGEQIPQHPFFFIHEYKPHIKSTPSDPLGQLLIAMVVANELNQDKIPLYGAYIIGKHWQFIVLETNMFAESISLDATQMDDLLQIFRMLKDAKQRIEALLM